MSNRTGFGVAKTFKVRIMINFAKVIISNQNIAK